MSIMDWRHVLKPTRWKITLSLMPLILPLVQVIFGADEGKIYEYMSVDVLIALDGAFLFLGFVETVISQPFEPILQPLGWWSSSGIFVGPDGPLLPGSFVVAVTYSVLIYIIWSLIGHLRKRSKPNNTPGV